jgi:hypothetical protein
MLLSCLEQLSPLTCAGGTLPYAEKNLPCAPQHTCKQKHRYFRRFKCKRNRLLYIFLQLNDLKTFFSFSIRLWVCHCSWTGGTHHTNQRDRVGGSGQHGYYGWPEVDVCGVKSSLIRCLCVYVSTTVCVFSRPTPSNPFFCGPTFLLLITVFNFGLSFMTMSNSQPSLWLHLTFICL